MTTPIQVKEDMRTLLERMPWRGKFTATQVPIIEARRRRVVDAMTDAVGLFGQSMYVDPSSLNILAAHVALAGDFFDDGAGKFIEYRVRDIETPDGQFVFKDMREWRKVGEFDADDEPPTHDAEAEYDAAVEQMRRMPAHLRRKAIAAMAAEFEAAATNDDEDGHQ